MRTAQVALSFLAVNPVLWLSDCVWGAPLVVLTVVTHVLGLGLINQRAIRPVNARMERLHRRATTVFMVVLGATTVLATALHAIEAGIWAAVYLLLGALPDRKSAMLYSLSAITSYGHANLVLESHWQLMGAIEALNGLLLFGLTTAFLFGVIEKVGLWGAGEGTGSPQRSRVLLQQPTLAVWAPRNSAKGSADQRVFH